MKRFLPINVIVISSSTWWRGSDRRCQIVSKVGEEGYEGCGQERVQTLQDGSDANSDDSSRKILHLLGLEHENKKVIQGAADFEADSMDSGYAETKCTPSKIRPWG